MKLTYRLSLLACGLLFTAGSARAQFWHALPAVSEDKSPSASFSNDEKKAFFLSSESGVPNIWMVPIKGGAAVQVTKFTDHGVVRAMHLNNLPEVIYMRAIDAAGKDFHIYRQMDDGSNAPQDLTGGGEGVTSQLLGSSYNGRYIYFTSNKVSKDKVDTYRYDTQQYITELIFPNDRDFQPLAWSRNHAQLLMEDPSNGEILLFDIASTERIPLTKPSAGHYTRALLDPTNHSLLVLEPNGASCAKKVMDLRSKSWVDATAMNADIWKQLSSPGINWVDYSQNGKYMIMRDGENWSVRDAATGAEVALPAGSMPVSISPKETMVLYTTTGADGVRKLALYDLTKKASVDLATIK